MLHHGFGEDVGEEGVLRAIAARLSEDDEAVRRKEGLSLLDLKHEAEARGYRAQGFKLAPQYVPELKGPVIVFIQPRGYAHFAVLRGVRGDRVYLADPARGNLRMPVYRFLDMWLAEDGQGVIFVVEGAEGGGAVELALDPDGPDGPRPERLTARQLLEVGNPFARLPGLVQ